MNLKDIRNIMKLKTEVARNGYWGEIEYKNAPIIGPGMELK